MGKPKVTPWFDGNVKPVRVGVYETPLNHAKGCHWFNFFDGRGWHAGGSTPRKAITRFPLPLHFAVSRWRGLAEQPK